MKIVLRNHKVKVTRAKYYRLYYNFLSKVEQWLHGFHGKHKVYFPTILYLVHIMLSCTMMIKYVMMLINYALLVLTVIMLTQMAWPNIVMIYNSV